MNDHTPPDDGMGPPGPGFHSRDTAIVIIDIEGTMQPEPPSPALRKLGEAERARIARWEAEQARQQSQTPGQVAAPPEQGPQEKEPPAPY